jgi:hypothetical protein
MESGIVQEVILATPTYHLYFCLQEHRRCPGVWFSNQGISLQQFRILLDIGNISACRSIKDTDEYGSLSALISFGLLAHTLMWRRCPCLQGCWKYWWEWLMGSGIVWRVVPLLCDVKESSACRGFSDIKEKDFEVKEHNVWKKPNTKIHKACFCLQEHDQCWNVWFFELWHHSRSPTLGIYKTKRVSAAHGG